MKHYDDTGEFGNSVVGDSGGYGGSGKYCVSIGSGESSDAGDTGYKYWWIWWFRGSGWPVNLISRFIIA